MGNRQIRTGQLIAPFGPGSIYTDRRGVPLIVAGLDHCLKRWDAGEMVPCEKPDEFELSEPRLSALLKVNRFRTPPDYRTLHQKYPDGQRPPNAYLFIPALRFPRWYRNTKTAEMRRFNLDTAWLPSPEGGADGSRCVSFPFALPAILVSSRGSNGSAAGARAMAAFSCWITVVLNSAVFKSNAGLVPDPHPIDSTVGIWPGQLSNRTSMRANKANFKN